MRSIIVVLFIFTSNTVAGSLYCGGKVEKLNLPAHFDFNSLRLTPDQVKKIKEEFNLIFFMTH